MDADWIRTVLEIVALHGYPLLLLISTVENVVLIGMFIPGDAIAILGGAACANHVLSPVPTAITVACGVIAGSIVSFAIGARGGVILLSRWGARVGFTHDKFETVRHYFERHGSKTVFVGCFLSGLKNLVPAVAGASKMRFAPFAGYSVAAATVRSALLVALGYGFARSLDRAFRLLHTADAWLLGLLGLSLGGWIVVYGLRKRRGQSGKGGERDT